MLLENNLLDSSSYSISHAYSSNRIDNETEEISFY